MTNERPPQIQAHHLDRLALVYIRQSTLRQVRDNHDSTEYQRCLRNLALTWGWQPAQIIVVNDDLGRAGIGTKERKGYQQLVRLVGQGQVGGIFCANTSRLGRVSNDVHDLLAQCRLHRTLLISDSHIINLYDSMHHRS